MRRSNTASSDHQDFWVTLPNVRNPSVNNNFMLVERILFIYLLHQSIKLQKYIEDGRRELQRRLSKHRYQEIERAYLENKFRYRFGTSPLPASFHVRDAIGAAIVVIRKRASGIFIQLNKKVAERAVPTQRRARVQQRLVSSA